MGKEQQWVEALLRETYFGACDTHASVRKNERNVFCANCRIAICQHCVPSHLDHSLLQIRRYVYHDVIRLHDIEKMVNCEYVQSYIVNSAKVVFLNQRPQSRPAKGVGNACELCDRILQDGWRFCSLACKVDAARQKGEKDGNRGLQSFLPTAWPSQRNCGVERLSPNCIFPEPTSSNLSPASSVSTAEDSSPAIVRRSLPQGRKFPKSASVAFTATNPVKSSLSSHIVIQESDGLSKLFASSSPSTSNSIKSLSSANIPGSLKWARTMKWPMTGKLAKRLPFTPYDKLSIRTKPVEGPLAVMASHPFEPDTLDHYSSPSDDDTGACVQYGATFSLPKRRKGTPHRSPIF